MSPNPLRSLPSVNELLESPPLRKLMDRISQNVVVSIVRKALDELRTEVQTAAAEMTMPSVADLAERIARRIAEGDAPGLRPVINATGVLLHPGLGGPPLADEAIAEMAAVSRDFASVELDLASGRPSRQSAAVEELLKELTGAEAALIVNHSAGATLLTLAALAAGREVIVSRGQLTERAGGCRLTEVAAAGGASLCEVGATNTTRLHDYARAIGAATAALLLVQPSNFVVLGFTEGVPLRELVQLGRQHKLPVIHDLGCGALVDLSPFGLSGEPVVRESIAAGADLVLFGGDRLLGGPQCGIVIGRKGLLQKIEGHAMARTLQVDKPTLAALAATLRLYRDPEQARLAIPLLRLLGTSVENLKNRAERLAPQMAAAACLEAAEAIPAETSLDGSAVPHRNLPTWCVALKPRKPSAERLAARLRLGTPAVVGRVHDDRVLLDLRSVLPRQDVQLVAAVEAVAAAAPQGSEATG